MNRQEKLRIRYREIRQYSLQLMAPLQEEDYLAQSTFEASPPKWHLGHCTWFFEYLVIKAIEGDKFQAIDEHYSYYFNSYYEALGPRVDRAARASLTRPSLNEVREYRQNIDAKIEILLKGPDLDAAILDTLELGLNHEQQHQELFLTDFKKALAQQAFYPVYDPGFKEDRNPLATKKGWIHQQSGLYDIGTNGPDFHFDNEGPRHKVYLNAFAISKGLISNAEWLEFMEAGGYQKPDYWHSDGWAWRNQEKIEAPLYWARKDGQWYRFSLSGLEQLPLDSPVTHISFYEAYAYSRWCGLRLPTEAEWEVANKQFTWGERWEWTNSAYLPYPGYQEYEGPAREYNGKFMVNQMVLRGASIASPEGHSRETYRNFFHPWFRWQFTGLRLAKDIYQDE